MHKLESVLVNEIYKNLRDIETQAHLLILNRKTDLMVINKQTKKRQLAVLLILKFRSTKDKKLRKVKG